MGALLQDKLLFFFRYPLLLSRLHKVTPIHHKDRNALKEAQQKVELHLEHINQVRIAFQLVWLYLKYPFRNLD